MDLHRPVVEVARELVGWRLAHGETAGTIVETEAYHDTEPACHAHAGLTERTRVLFGAPGHFYVYRSYGIHALINVVCEEEGVGAAVLLRALQPTDGLELMRLRRGVTRDRDLCSGPGKLTQALGIELSHNGEPVHGGPVRLLPPDGPPPELEPGVRIGITKAVELPWRFCTAGSPWISRPRPSLTPPARRTARAAPPGRPRRAAR